MAQAQSALGAAALPPTDDDAAFRQAMAHVDGATRVTAQVQGRGRPAAGAQDEPIHDSWKSNGSRPCHRPVDHHQVRTYRIKHLLFESLHK